MVFLVILAGRRMAICMCWIYEYTTVKLSNQRSLKLFDLLSASICAPSKTGVDAYSKCSDLDCVSMTIFMNMRLTIYNIPIIESRLKELRALRETVVYVIMKAHQCTMSLLYISLSSFGEGMFLYLAIATTEALSKLRLPMTISWSRCCSCSRSACHSERVWLLCDSWPQTSAIATLRLW